jgi:hypothetical protein
LRQICLSFLSGVVFSSGIFVLFFCLI